MTESDIYTGSTSMAPIGTDSKPRSPIRCHWGGTGIVYEILADVVFSLFELGMGRSWSFLFVIDFVCRKVNPIKLLCIPVPPQWHLLGLNWKLSQFDYFCSIRIKFNTFRTKITEFRGFESVRIDAIEVEPVYTDSWITFDIIGCVFVKFEIWFKFSRKLLKKGGDATF